MLNDLLRSVVSRLRGERRRKMRVNQDHTEAVNRQYTVAVKLARKLGTTPEELLDYRRADAILAERR